MYKGAEEEKEEEEEVHPQLAQGIITYIHLRMGNMPVKNHITFDRLCGHVVHPIHPSTHTHTQTHGLRTAEVIEQNFSCPLAGPKEVALPSRGQKSQLDFVECVQCTLDPVSEVLALGGDVRSPTVQSLEAGTAVVWTQQAAGDIGLGIRTGACARSVRIRTDSSEDSRIQALRSYLHSHRLHHVVVVMVVSHGDL